MARTSTGKSKSKTKTRKVKESQDQDTTKSNPEGPAVAVEEPEVATVDNETHAKYEEVKRGELHITDLQKMTVAELHGIAREEGLTEYAGLKKQELIFRSSKSEYRKTALCMARACWRSCRTALASCVRLTITTCPARMIYTYRPARYAGSACERAALWQVRYGRRRNPRDTLRFCVWKQSTMKTPIRFLRQ